MRSLKELEEWVNNSPLAITIIVALMGFGLGLMMFLNF